MANFDLGLGELFSREIDLEIEADVKEMSSADDEIKLFLKNSKSKSAVYKEKTSVNRLYEFMDAMEPPMKKKIYELSNKNILIMLKSFHYFCSTNDRSKVYLNLMLDYNSLSNP